MNAFNDLFYFVIDLVLVKFYGWVAFLYLLGWLYFTVRKIANQDKFAGAIEWVFLEVKVEELNERSPLAMEQVFAALHAIHTNFTFGERFFEGKMVMWMSCEIVSVGGRVSFIFKIPTRYRNLLESAIFAQYPKAEVNQVEDYLRNIDRIYHPEKVDFEFWGTQLNKKKENSYPVKTFGAFEHPEQKTFIDPLSNVIEAMSNIDQHELMVAQFVIRPIDESWKVRGKKLIDKLKGAPVKKGKPGVAENMFVGMLDWIVDLIATDVLGAPKGEAKTTSKQDEPPSQMLHKTEGERQVIAAVEHGLTKLTYEAKVRLFYLAPKGKLNKSLRVPEIIGAFRNFEDVSLNALKPDVGRTWTDAPYRVFKKLERPYLEQKILGKKRRFLFNFKERSVGRGTGVTYFNTEGLATLYHFPQSPNVRVSQVEHVQNVKSAPPMNLPVIY
jgi:hypothetical protein